MGTRFIPFIGTTGSFDINMFSLLNSFVLATAIQSVYGQFFGGGGSTFGGGFNGFGCGSYLPTVGNECYQPETGKGTVVCVATGSSVYANVGYYGDYNAYLATDGNLSPGNSGFYHSNLEPYPALRIELRKIDNSDYEPKDVARVEIYQRCDANELYHRTTFDIKWTDDPTDPAKAVVPSPRLVGGKYCGNTQQTFFTGGTKFIVPCAVPAAAAKQIWIQKTTLHSQGNGWPNYNGNQWNSYSGNAPAQNSNWPVAFLMINEVVLY